MIPLSTPLRHPVQNDINTISECATLRCGESNPDECFTGCTHTYYGMEENDNLHPLPNEWRRTRAVTDTNFNVTINQHLSWEPLISAMISRAHCKLGFFVCNLRWHPWPLRETVYAMIVRAGIDFDFPIWDHTEALKRHRVLRKSEICYLIRMTEEWKRMSSGWNNNNVVTHPDEIPTSGKSSGWHMVVCRMICHPDDILQCP